MYFSGALLPILGHLRHLVTASVMTDLTTNSPATSLAYQISRQKIQFQPIACALTNREWTLDTDQSRSPTHAILLKAGRGHLLLPHDTLDFAAPALLWLPPRTAERLHIKAGGAGFLLAMSDEILANTTGTGADLRAQRRFASGHVGDHPSEITSTGATPFRTSASPSASRRPRPPARTIAASA